MAVQRHAATGKRVQGDARGFLGKQKGDTVCRRVRWGHAALGKRVPPDFGGGTRFPRGDAFA